MPPPREDPTLLLLGRLLEAIQSLDVRSETRDRQVQQLADEIRRHGEVEREQAAVIADLRDELKLRREADEKVLATVRAGREAAQSNLQRFVASPVFLPLVTALITGLLTAVGMSYTAPQGAQASADRPAHQETAP